MRVKKLQWIAVGSVRTMVAVVLAAGVLGCAGSRPAVGGGPPRGALPGPPGSPTATGGPGAMQRLYGGMGLIASGGAIPFVSSVSFLRSPTADSTLALLAVSLSARSLGFAREGDRYAASYTVRVEVRQGGTVVRQIEATEIVRVPTFRETSRTDESVIWQQFVRLAPGRYTLAMNVKDESSIRASSEEVALEVPRLSVGQLATPVPVYEAIPRSAIDSLPRILARPRSTVVFGQDSLLPVYLDAVGPESPAQVQMQLIGDGDVVLWDNATTLPVRGTGHSATLGIPVGRMAVGVNTLQITAAGRTDTVRTRILVSLGDDLPIASFAEMLTYLRYYTTADRIKPLRDATPVQRAEVWAAFLKETDPVPATSEHEGLRDYFLRIRTANVRFRDDAQVGWQSDRGIAFVALGDPDNIVDTGMIDPSARIRQQIWEYRGLRMQLIFVDQSGFGRWRLTPQGRADLENAIRRRLAEKL